MQDQTAETIAPIESPPASSMPAHEVPDARAQLMKLAAQLVRAGNRRLLIEYLRLRRTMR